MPKPRKLSLCEHPIGIDRYKGLKCSCGSDAEIQMRLYINPGNMNFGSIAFSRYYCKECLHAFKTLMSIPQQSWHIKIDIEQYTLESNVILEYEGKP